MEQLLHPEDQPAWEEDLYLRAFPRFPGQANLYMNQIRWSYQMITTKRPLEEKMALFWHGLLCSGEAKVDHSPDERPDRYVPPSRPGQLPGAPARAFQGPAMVYFLDNVENHKGSINENYGRSCWSCSLWASAWMGRLTTPRTM